MKVISGEKYIEVYEDFGPKKRRDLVIKLVGCYDNRDWHISEMMHLPNDIEQARLISACHQKAFEVLREGWGV